MTRCPAPNRLMINLVGVRDIDFDSLSESLLETPAVQDAYRMMVLDDSRFGVVIVLNPGWSCEVSEHTDPGALMLSFKEDAGAEEEARSTTCARRPCPIRRSWACSARSITPSPRHSSRPSAENTS